MGKELVALLLLLALAVATAASDGSPHQARIAEDEGVDLLRVQSGSQALLFVVSRATFGAALPRVSSPTQLDARSNDDALLHIVRGNVSDDCSSVTTLLDSAEAGDVSDGHSWKTAVLVDRGGHCSFVQKALAVQHSGASLVIVRDTIVGAFASARQPGGVSAYDCSLGDSSVSSNASFPVIDTSTLEQEPNEVSACIQAHTCASGTCVLTGEQQESTKRFQVCCFQNRMIRMNADDDSQQLAAKVRIPAVFLDYRDAEALEQLMMSRVSSSSSAPAILAHAFSSEESPWNVSMALSWLLGVSVVMSAAYYSCAHERVFSYQKVAHALASSLGNSSRSKASNECGDGYVSIDDNDNDHYGSGSPRVGADERLELTGRHALVFLIGASCVLLLVYYVHILLLISILFAIGASVAMAQVFFVPLCLTVLPLSWTASGNRVLYISASLGLGIAIFWFAERTSPYIWPLQDLLCIALCFVFIDTIQLPSLRVGAILLCVAFVYDVFFVYLSPFVFGSNVMVDVASGGGNTRVAGGFLDHCQQHPEEPECRHHQTVPMVLSIPLLFSFYGGNALLGLGDLIIPGLLVSFCIRYDYCMGYPLSTKYFCVASASYALGLLLANVMAILLRNVVAGQPALMYIVPLMLSAVLGFAKLNGELQVMWDGPLCLQMLQDEHHAFAENDDDPENGETQPLVAAKANAT